MSAVNEQSMDETTELFQAEHPSSSTNYHTNEDVGFFNNNNNKVETANNNNNNDDPDVMDNAALFTSAISFSNDDSLTISDSADFSSTTKKRYVEVAVVFLKIGEIDTVKEQYSADIYIHSRWHEPLLDKKTAKELRKADLQSFWNPRLYIENELVDKKSALTQSVKLGETGEAFVSERRKMRGDFLENLELQDFPLDVQDLSITIVSELPDSVVELVPNEEDMSTVNVDTFADKQEWKLYEHVEATKSVKVEFGHHQQQQHSQIQFTCHAARRTGYFCYNTLFIMFLLCSMSFLSFAVDCNLAHTRIQLMFTLVLTFIAYKTAVNLSLPKISYLTYMDKYILVSLIYLVLVACWHASAGKYFCSDKTAYFYVNGVENWVLLGFFILYSVANVVFACFLYFYGLKRRRQMKRKDREFRRRVLAGREQLAHQSIIK